MWWIEKSVEECCVAVSVVWVNVLVVAVGKGCGCGSGGVAVKVKILGGFCLLVFHSRKQLKDKNKTKQKETPHIAAPLKNYSLRKVKKIIH